VKTIGLVGIANTQALSRYHNLMDRLSNRELRPAVQVQAIEVSDIGLVQSSSDWDDVGARLTQAALQLEASGAGLVILAGSTLHGALPLSLPVSIPLLHIADVVAETLICDGASTCGLLGSRQIMETDAISARLHARGIETLVPETGRTNLDGIIGEELNQGIVNDASREVYIAAIEQLAARGVQAVVLASTTLPLLISDDDSPLPLYDAAALHVEAALATVMSVQ